MAHHNDVNIYGRIWTAPDAQTAENWRNFIAGRAFSLESEESVRANNKYIEVVYKLEKHPTDHGENRDAIYCRHGNSLVATGDYIDGKMVVRPWQQDDYDNWTPVPDNSQVVGYWDPYNSFDNIFTGLQYTDVSGVFPEVGGPVVDPNDDNVAYWHGPMLIEGYVTTRNSFWNYNDHYPHPGHPQYSGFYGVNGNTIEDDTWYSSAGMNSGKTYVGPTPSRPTSFAFGISYVNAAYTV